MLYSFFNWTFSFAHYYILPILIKFIGTKNLIKIYIYIRYYWLLIKDIFHSKVVNNIYQLITYTDDVVTQELIDIKLIVKNIKGKKQSHSLRKKIPPTRTISISDIHNAIQNSENIQNTENSNIEITYKIGQNNFIYTFPIYITKSPCLPKDGSLILNHSIFPIHNHCDIENIDDSPEYIYANFTLSLSNEANNTIDYDCPNILKMYSGPHGDFYQDKSVITITNDHVPTRVPYKLSIEMLNLSHYIPNITPEHNIISIDALRDDNVDLIVNLEKKIMIHS